MNLLDHLFPDICVGCTKRGSLLCAECLDRIDLGGITTELAWGSVHSFSNFRNDVVRSVVHAIKYQGQYRLVATVMRRASIPELPRQAVLVPVPSSRARLRQRGFNQSEVLAHCLAKQSGLSVDVALLGRRGSKALVGLSKKERTQVAAAQYFLRGSTAGKDIILVDDVLTTGATLSACAALMPGVRIVGAITLAYEPLADTPP